MSPLYSLTIQVPEHRKMAITRSEVVRILQPSSIYPIRGWIFKAAEVTEFVAWNFQQWDYALVGYAAHSNTLSFHKFAYFQFNSYPLERFVLFPEFSGCFAFELLCVIIVVIIIIFQRFSTRPTNITESVNITLHIYFRNLSNILRHQTFLPFEFTFGCICLI